ncbi:MAG: hypothetical protein AAF649_00410 [Verrucomicrobiota bacterium]
MTFVQSINISRAQLIILASFFLVTLCVVPQFGEIIRESDQASIYTGALKIADDCSLSGNYYQYGYQYLAYWVLVPLFQFFRESMGAAILLANVGSSLFFWCALVFVLSFRVKETWQAWLSGAVLLTPCFLHHSPYFAPNFLSAALVAILFGVGRATNLKKTFYTFVLTFLATGARADVILAMPFVFWMMYPRWYFWKRDFFAGLFAGFTGCVSALVLGKWVSAESGQAFYDFFIYPKLFAAYSVFGLGPVIFIFPVLTFLILLPLENFLKNKKVIESADCFGGSCALLLPLAFYALQLFSTRHWVLVATISLLAIASDRIKTSWRLWNPTPSKVAVKKLLIGIVVLSATLPLFFGVRAVGNLAFKPVLTDSTQFPTSDGLIPMGAYLEFGWQYSGDHTQNLWNSFRRSDLEAYLTEGDLPILYAGTLRSVLEFSAQSSGLNYRLVSFDEAEKASHFIADDRLWRRKQVQLHIEPDDEKQPLLKKTAIQMVKNQQNLENGIIIVQAGSNEISRRWASWRTLFKGNEFREIEWASLQGLIKSASGGHSLALYSQHPFTVSFSREESPAAVASAVTLDYGHGVYLGADGLKEIESLKVNYQGQVVHAAVSYYPEFMNENQLYQ